MPASKWSTPALSSVASEYARSGFVVVPKLLSDDVVAQARDLVGGIIQAAVSGGELTGTSDEVYSREVALAERQPYVQFERNATDTEADVLDRVRKVMNFHREPPIDALLEPDGAVTLLAEALLGPRPVPLHCLAQVKPPRIGREKGWHQDTAYFSVLPIHAVVGIWIALDRAHEANGCLEVLPGAHLDGPIVHEHVGECRIMPERLDLGAAVPVVLEPGDAVAFNGLMPHGSKPNRSNERRWALTFHYRGEAARVVPDVEFDRAFVDAGGEPAGCAAAARRASPVAAAEWGARL